MLTTTRAIALGLLVSLAAGCADNPVTPEEHFEARGVVLLRSIAGSDSTIATVDTTHISGRIVIDTSAGQDFIVRFIADDGALGLPSPDADGVWENDLSISVSDTTIARAGQVTRWGFRLNGIRPGATTLTVHLLHGGHDDYVSAPIPVVVEP
ncbi:MAG TPA: hypothetical protein VNA88_15500 [Candidatus Kapabacteria bacterium]|nr:hypothetical protein [Candidatus Kapabacteria bacterium]